MAQLPFAELSRHYLAPLGREAMSWVFTSGCLKSRRFRAAPDPFVRLRARQARFRRPERAQVLSSGATCTPSGCGLFFGHVLGLKPQATDFRP